KREVKSDEDSRSQRKVSWMIYVGLLLFLGYWAYRNSFDTPFIFDDMKIISKRAAAYSWDNLETVLAKTRRPLLHLSIAANYNYSGLDTVGYHIFNFSIHVIAGLTLFGLTRRTLRLRGVASRYRRASAGIAFAVAAIWMLHPLQTESVTYIVQRCESMMGMFFLLCLYCTLRGSRARFDNVQPRIWYLFAIICFYLGLMSKEVMAAALVVLPLYDRVFLASAWKEVIKKRWALYLGFTPILIWFAIGMTNTFVPHRLRAAGFGVTAFTPLQYLQSQAVVICHYLKLSFWPSQLCLDYLWEVEKDPIRIYGCGAIIVTLFIASCIALWYRPRLGVLGISFFMILAPTSSFIPIVDIAFEHRMYLPLAPLVALVVLLAYEITRLLFQRERDQRLVRGGLLLLVLLSLTIRTTIRNRDYEYPKQMWQNVVDQAPHNFSAHNNLALHYADPKSLDFNIDMALKHYRTSIKLKDDFPRTHNNIGNLHARQQQFAQAAVHYRRALVLDEEFTDARIHLGIVLYEQGQTVAAIAEFREAIKNDPESLTATNRLAWVLATAPEDLHRDGHEALKLARGVYEVTGDKHFQTLEVLAAAYAETGRFRDAVIYAQQAKELAKQHRATSSYKRMKEVVKQYSNKKPYRFEPLPEHINGPTVDASPVQSTPDQQAQSN
ncbi:MAG: tetratricopeptide (TPR) repeat protein, partial [Pirellulaceae bacterium]